MAEAFNPYYKWLGISLEEQPANHYRLLGLGLFESDSEVIESAADRQMAHVQTHKNGPHSALSQKMLNELATVRLCLLDSAKKAAYDQTLRANLPAATPVPTISAAMPAIVPVIHVATATHATPSIALSSAPRHSELAARGRRSKRSLIPAVSIVVTLVALGLALFYSAERPAAPQKSPAQAPDVGNALVSIPVVVSQPDAVVSATSKTAANPPQVSAAAVGADTPSGGATVVSDPRRRLDQIVATADTPIGGATVASDLRHQLDKIAATAVTPTGGAPSSRPPSMPKSEPSDKPVAMPGPQRLASPVGEPLAMAEAAVDEMFQAEISAAKTPIEQYAVARRLFDRSFAPDLTPEVSYVLLDRCSQVAASSGRYDVACEAVDTMAARFETDVVKRKIAALETSDRFAKSPPEFRKLTGAWMDLADEATVADQYLQAKQCLDRAAATARKSSDQSLVARAVDAGKEAAVILAAYEKVASARERLVGIPGDTAAAAAWGRFLCTYKNDWDAGLATWAKGDDSLAEAARSDLVRPPFSSEQRALADRWWNAAEAEKKPLPQKLLRLRAAYWYRNARIGASSSDLVRIQERIDQAEQIASAFPIGQWVDLLKTIDLTKHLLQGNWQSNGNVLSSPQGRGDNRLLLPVAASGSYELEAALTFGPKDRPEVNFTFPVGSDSCMLILFGWDGKTSGLHLVDGKYADNNETTVREVSPPRGQRFKVLIHVELAGDEASISVDLNSRRFIRWHGLTSRLSLARHVTLPQASAFGLRSRSASVLVHSLRLRVHSGAAKTLE